MFVVNVGVLFFLLIIFVVIDSNSVSGVRIRKLLIGFLDMFISIVIIVVVIIILIGK